MKREEVVNSVFLVPMILDKINGSTNENIDKALRDFNIDVNDYTPIQNLLKYNLEIVKNNFRSNDDIYGILRKGLNENFNLSMSNFWETLGEVNTHKVLVDYGAGDGAYSQSFREYNPNGMTFEVERKRGMHVDFESQPNWYEVRSLEKSADIVLLSEILHCKGMKWQDYLIESSKALLKNDGKIIINENLDPFMGYRLNHLTSEGDMMDENDVIYLINRHNLKLTSIKTFSNHKTYICERL